MRKLGEKSLIVFKFSSSEISSFLRFELFPILWKGSCCYLQLEKERILGSEWKPHIFFLSTDPLSWRIPTSMQKQVFVKKEYSVNLTNTKQGFVAKARKGTLEPTDLITKVVTVEESSGTHDTLTAGELAEILDMFVGGDTRRTKTSQMQWIEFLGGREFLS